MNTEFKLNEERNKVQEAEARLAERPPIDTFPYGRSPSVPDVLDMRWDINNQIDLDLDLGESSRPYGDDLDLDLGESSRPYGDDILDRPAWFDE